MRTNKNSSTNNQKPGKTINNKLLYKKVSINSPIKAELQSTKKRLVVTSLSPQTDNLGECINCTVMVLRVGLTKRQKRVFRSTFLAGPFALPPDLLQHYTSTHTQLPDRVVLQLNKLISILQVVTYDSICDFMRLRYTLPTLADAINSLLLEINSVTITGIYPSIAVPEDFTPVSFPLNIIFCSIAMHVRENTRQLNANSICHCNSTGPIATLVRSLVYWLYHAIHEPSHRPIINVAGLG